MADFLKISKQVRFLQNKLLDVSSNKTVIANDLRKLAQEIEDEEETPEFKEYRNLLNKIKSKESIQKLKLFIDNPRLRKPWRTWLIMLDKGEGAGVMDYNEMLQKIKILLQRDLPAAQWLKAILNYGIENGFVALDRMLSRNQAKVKLLKEVTASKIAQQTYTEDEVSTMQEEDVLDNEEDLEEAPEFKEYRNMLNKLKSKESIQKLKLFIDNPRLRKPWRTWLIMLDKGEGAGTMDYNEMLQKIKILLQRDLPAARWLRAVLDYGVQNGFIALDRMLSRNQAKVKLLREEGI